MSDAGRDDNRRVRRRLVRLRPGKHRDHDAPGTRGAVRGGLHHAAETPRDQRDTRLGHEPADLLRELGLLRCRIACPEHAQLTHLRSVRPLHSRPGVKGSRCESGTVPPL